MTVVWLDGRPYLDRAQVGGKAQGINTMIGMGLPVPPAFTVTTETCRDYHRAGRHLPHGLMADLANGIGQLERATGLKFGEAACPLRISVRSGAAHSMPGMLDTILDLGAVPARAWEQLPTAVAAVFDSWWSGRATTYRREHGISDDGGTAVTVQAMVFGDAGADSGTGVLFTRNPLDGRAEPYGEWLPGARGEDLVAGRRTPLPLTALAHRLPGTHAELLTAGTRLESAARWPQDIEFTVENGRLWLLQTRDARLPPAAAVRVAVAGWRAGLIDVGEALERVDARQVARLRPYRVLAQAHAVLLCQGEPACPGIASGVVVTDPEHARERAGSGEDVVLARPCTDPGDVAAMFQSRAVLTEVGGVTSHAAIVCREIGKPCVVGCGLGSLTALNGRLVAVDGSTGAVYDGLPSRTAVTKTDPDLALFHTWMREEARP